MAGRSAPASGPAALPCRAAPADEEELLLLAVRPEERGCGVGAVLLSRYIDAAHERGARRLFLEMREGNIAERLYRAQGISSGRATEELLLFIG